MAVFDGHSGADVSALLRDRLYKSFIQKIEEKSKCGNGDDELGGDGPWVPTIKSHVNSLSDAFDEVEQEVLKDDRLHYQGSTAVAVALHEQENGHRTLISANVGDSRAILSRGGHAIGLTRDHKPGDEFELARIRSMGEKVVCDVFGEVCRVRKLAISRAIGDRFAKPVVTGKPELKQIPVCEDDEFVLLASDGLWDVMTSQEVVSFVHSNLDAVQEDHSSHGDSDLERALVTIRQRMSSFIANEALRRGSDDNVCVVILWLDGKGGDTSDPQQSVPL